MACRPSETHRAQKAVAERRSLWLTAEAWSGKYDFITTLAHVLEKHPRLYRVDLSLYDSNADVLSAAALDILAIQSDISTVENAWLLLENPFGLAGSEVSPNAISNLHELINAFLDGSPSIIIIVFFDNGISIPRTDVINLSPLDEASTRQYVSLHDKGDRAVEVDVTSGALYRFTQGYPEKIDELLGELNGSSIENLVSYGTESRLENASPPRISEFRKLHIQRLVTGSKDSEIRMLLLLKALAVLPYGIDTEDVSHFVPSLPFHPRQVGQLSKLGLLKTFADSGISNRDRKEFLLPVSEVSDYLRSLLNASELNALYIQGLSVLMGPDWRIGKFKILYGVIPEDSARYSPGARNLSEILVYLVADCFNRVACNSPGASDDLRHILTAFEFYTRKVYKADYHRDIYELCLLLDKRLKGGIDNPKVVSVMYRYAVSCRMLGFYDSAKALCLTLLRSEGARDLTLSVNLELAKIFHKEGDHSRRNSHLGVLLKVRKKSALTLAAEALSYEYQGVPDLNQKLSRIVIQAKRAGHHAVLHNISITLARGTKDRRAKAEMYKEIALSAKKHGDVYNWARSTVHYYSAVVHLQELHGSQVEELWLACSYFRNERNFILFDEAFRILWHALKEQRASIMMIRLYLDNTVYLRLAEKTDLERSYLAELMALLREDGVVLPSDTAERIKSRWIALEKLGTSQSRLTQGQEFDLTDV